MNYRTGQEMTFLATEKEMIPLMEKMSGHYKQAAQEIIRELQRIYGKYLTTTDPQDYYNIMIQSARNNRLLEQVQGIYSEYSKAAAKDLGDISKLAMSNTYYRNQYMLTWFTPAEINLSFSILDPKLIELTVSGTDVAWSAIKKAMDEVTARQYMPAYGTLKNLLKRNEVNDLVKIQQTITQAFINGHSIDDLSSNIKGVFDTAQYQAERIAQTEFTRCSNAGDFAATQDAADQGLNVQKMWCATLDDKTRESHQELDGQIVGIDEPFVTSDGQEALFPGDFVDAAETCNCRCTTITLVDGDMPELRRGRDPESGENEVFSYQKYDDWMYSKGFDKDESGKWVKAN